MNKPLFEPAYEDSEESSEDDGDKGKLNTKKTLSYKNGIGYPPKSLKSSFCFQRSTFQGFADDFEFLQFYNDGFFGWL